MSDTEKKYRNLYLKNKKTDYSTLIYLLVLLLLGGVLIGGGLYLYNRWKKGDDIKQMKAFIHNVQNENPSSESNRKIEDTYSHILSNFQQVKKINDKINENPEKLGIWREDLEKIEQDLTTYEELKAVKKIPDQLEEIYLKVYRQTVRVGRLKNVIFSKEENKRQWEEQEKWLDEKCSEEEAEAIEPINKLMVHIYKRFYDQLTPEEKTPYNIEPFVIQRRPADPTKRKAEIDYLVEKHHLHAYENPPFYGFDGFLTEKEAKGSKENSFILGLTIPMLLNPRRKDDRILYVCTPGCTYGEGKDKGIYFEADGDICRYTLDKLGSKIKLKKELLFSRQNPYYNEWITDFNEEKDIVKSYLDIGEDCLLDTIAHELAHAIINANHLEYKGERGGGEVRERERERETKVVYGQK